MTAPLGAALSQTAKLNFAGQGVQLPVRWRDMGSLYPQAFTPAEQVTQSNAPTNLFHEPTLNRYHTASARTVGRATERYIEGVCAAIADAIDKWMRMASVASLTINGSIGTLLPGGLTGPLLKPFILAKAPCSTDFEREYSNAIAEAVSNGWLSWQQGLSGVLNYPAPVSAPASNTPAPLVTFGSSGEGALTPTPLKNAMTEAMQKDGQHAGTLFDAVAQSFYSHFQTFKTSTVVSNVIAAGVTVIPTPGNFV